MLTIPTSMPSASHFAGAESGCPFGSNRGEELGSSNGSRLVAEKDILLPPTQQHQFVPDPEEHHSSDYGGDFADADLNGIMDHFEATNLHFIPASHLKR
jgi:hypothetical protein